MRKLLKWLSLLVVLAVIAIAVVVYNPGLIKGVLERQISELTGYPVQLAGELKVRPGRVTDVTARNIRVSGPDWASQDDLISIGNLKVSLVTASLFRDIIVIESLGFEDLDLNLESNENDEGNWLSDRLQPATSDDDSDSSFVVLRHMEARDANVRFLRGATGIEDVLHIATLSHDRQSDEMLHATLDGNLNERAVALRTIIGPFDNLLEGRDVGFEISGHFGELSLNGQGHIADLLEPRHPVFDIELSGPDINEITSMLQLDDLGPGEFSLHTTGKIDDGRYRAGIDGSIGEVNLDVSLITPDLGQLEQAEFRAAIDIDGAQLQLDAVLSDFPSLDSSSVNVSISGEDIIQFNELLGVSGVSIGPFLVQGKLDLSAEGIELTQLALDTELGQASFSGLLRPGPGFTGSRIHTEVGVNSADSLMMTLGVNGFPAQAFTVNADVVLVEDGLSVDRCSLVTADDDHLNMTGTVTLNEDLLGTALEVGVSGGSLARTLQLFSPDLDAPEGPFTVQGNINVTRSGVLLDGVDATISGLVLRSTSAINLGGPFIGSGIDLEVAGDELTPLGYFDVIADSLDLFVPGQSFQASGRLTPESNGWRLDGLKGSVGVTALSIDGFFSDEPSEDLSIIRYSARGPGLESLLSFQDEAGVETGAFESSGSVEVSDDFLNIREFRYKTGFIEAHVELGMSLPFTEGSDLSFNMDLEGSDIRHLVAAIDAFDFYSAPFRIDAEGQVRADHLSLSKFDTRIGDFQSYLHGEFDYLTPSTGVEIGIGVKAKDLSSLGGIGGKPLPDLPVDLQTVFLGNLHDFKIRDLQGTFGDSQLAGSLDVSITGPVPSIDFALSSTHIDLEDFTHFWTADDDSGAPEPVDTITDSRVIPDIPIPLDSLAEADVSLRLNIGELDFDQDELRNIVLEADIQSGELRVPRISFDAPLGKLNGSFYIIPDKTGGADVRADLVGREIVFNLSGQEDERLAEVPRLDIEIHVTGSGDNLRDVAGTTNGTVFLGSEGGILEGMDLSLLDSFILEDIFSILMPKVDEDPFTELDCLAARFNLKDGLAKTRPALAFSSPRIIVDTRGTLDLRTEKMHFNFNATPRNILLINTSEIFQPYILIGGFLGEPEVGIDPEKALLHGGAAIGTAGISIVAKGLLDRMGVTKSQCEQILKAGPTGGKKSKRRNR